jgi:hypothetical protein
VNEKGELRADLMALGETDWENTESEESDYAINFKESGDLLIGYEFKGYINSFEIWNTRGDKEIDRTNAVGNNAFFNSGV